MNPEQNGITAFAAVDLKYHLSLFYVQHMLYSPNSAKRIDIITHVKEDLKV